MTTTWTPETVSRYAKRPEGLSRDLLDRHCNYVRKVIRNDFDWWTVNEGYEGTGKSTGAIHTARRVAGELFNVKEHVVYDAEELLRLIDDCPRYGCILLDEAGEVAFSRDWNTSVSKAIVKGSQQMRDRNLFVEFNLPSLELLDSGLRRRFRTLVIYEAPKFTRGRSMWHTPSYNRYGRKSDPYWDLRFVYYMKELPPTIREDYVTLKTQRGKERVQKYLEQVEREHEKNMDVDPGSIVDKIKRLPQDERAELLSSRGSWSKDRIAYKYGLPDTLARTVAAGLSMDSTAE